MAIVFLIKNIGQGELDNRDETIGVSVLGVDVPITKVNLTTNEKTVIALDVSDSRDSVGAALGVAIAQVLLRGRLQLKPSVSNSAC